MDKPDQHRDLTKQLVGRTIVNVHLADLGDGYAILTLDDGSRLEIRTSSIGDLLLLRGDVARAPSTSADA
jgi:hypothetical protein